MNLICPYGHRWDINFGDFKYGKRCPHCKTEAKKQGQLQEIKELMLKEGYALLEDKYINNSTPMKVLCPLGHEFYIRSSNFKKGRRCSECYKFKKLDHDYVYNLFAQEGYKILSTEYVSANKKMRVECPHGHEFEISYSKFYTGRRCPHCQKSSGEQRIDRILHKYNIERIYQHIFEDCRNVKPLPFDFYLPQYNVAIEFDGRQHFEDKYFESSNLLEIQKRDNIKTKYCENNNIKLIRIPYWESKNIEEIICQELKLNK